MITIANANKETKITQNGEFVLMELRGLSTDTKPTSLEGKIIENGSVFIEIDTGKVYLYDLDTEEWDEV